MRALILALVLGLASQPGFAQANTDYERRARDFCSRVGRDRSVVQRVEISNEGVEVSMQDGGDLYWSSSGRVLRYTNHGETLAANRRSKREPMPFDTVAAEALALGLLPSFERSDWIATKSLAAGANRGETSGTVTVTLSRVYYGLATGPDFLNATFDRFEGRLLSLSEVRGKAVVPPPIHRVSEDAARERAYDAVSRLEDPYKREAAQALWRSEAPRGQLEFFGMRNETGDAAARRLPSGLRLTWHFGNDHVWVSVDAETGAVCHVTGMMSGRSSASKETESMAMPEKSGRDHRPGSAVPDSADDAGDLPWMWGLAAIPVAVGAWLVLRARG